MPSTPQYFALVGRAHREGGVEILESFLTTAQEPTGSVADSGYTLAFVGVDGEVLDEGPFTVAFETPDSDVSMPTAAFSVVQSFPVETARVLLREAGKVVTTLERPSGPPTVGPVQVVRDSSSDELTVEWSMGGPVESMVTLTAGVELSLDGGDAWLPLVGGLRDPRFVLDATGLGASDSALVKVVASAGFETAEAVSEPFSLPGASPTAIIFAPVDGAELTAGAPEVLRGAVLDRRDGLLAHDALEWRLRSSGETRTVGSGGTLTLELTEGDHVIELLARNSSGMEVRTECRVSAVIAKRRPLRVIGVSATEAVSAFSTVGTVTVSDMVGEFSLPGTAGLGFVQSRTWPPGEIGTTGAGLTAFLYRVVLTDLVADSGADGVAAISVPFGDPVPLMFAAHEPTDVFVVTAGGVGSVGPSMVEADRAEITVLFDPPLRAGLTKGAGEDSFFVGIVSQNAPRNVEATVVDLTGAAHTVVVQSAR